MEAPYVWPIYAPNANDALAKHLGLAQVPYLAPRYNIAPTQPVATVLVMKGDRQFRLMRWGLVPDWAKDLSIGNRMINARAETLAQTPAFKPAMHERRCIITADEFYEWRAAGGTKQPMYIVAKDKSPLGFAGLLGLWESPGGEQVESCTIITTAANEVIAAFHERMPVILEPKDYGVWLDPTVQDPARLLPLLKSYPQLRWKRTPSAPSLTARPQRLGTSLGPLLEQVGHLGRAVLAGATELGPVGLRPPA